MNAHEKVSSAPARSGVFSLILAAALLASFVSPAAAQSQRTSLVSVNRDGTTSANGSSIVLINFITNVQRNTDYSSTFVTPDGRFVVFMSTATDLTDMPTANTRQIYVRDRLRNTTRLVSVNRSGTGGGNDQSMDPAISFDGRYVAFTSFASDLVEKDTNEESDVFVRDLVENKTTLVSVNRAGTDSGRGIPTLSNGAPHKFFDHSFFPLMSADGRRVVFQSYADDLVERDTNDALDIFVRDLRTGTTSCVSVNLAGVPSGNRTSLTSSGFFRFEPAISADARFVVFTSYASNLTENDTVCVETCNGSNSFSDVFMRDIVENKTTLLSVNREGKAGGNSGSLDPSISADGRVAPSGASRTT